MEHKIEHHVTRRQRDFLLVVGDWRNSILKSHQLRPNKRNSSSLLVNMNSNKYPQPHPTKRKSPGLLVNPPNLLMELKYYYYCFHRFPTKAPRNYSYLPLKINSQK